MYPLSPSLSPLCVEKGYVRSTGRIVPLELHSPAEVAEQIQSHEVVRDHLIGCGDGFTNSYLTRSHVPRLYEVGSHPRCSFPVCASTRSRETRDKSLMVSVWIDGILPQLTVVLLGIFRGKLFLVYFSLLSLFFGGGRDTTTRWSMYHI